MSLLLQLNVVHFHPRRKRDQQLDLALPRLAKQRINHLGAVLIVRVGKQRRGVKHIPSSGLTI
jgi:hypothetical protein